MPVSTDNIIKEDDLAQWPYLDGISIRHIQADVELLIGTNASKLLEPWEVICNSQGIGPYAIRTLLGWVINGPPSRKEMSRDDVKFMEIVKDSIRLEDGHYSLKLPFKIEASLPNNRCVAKQCILGMKRKFEKNEKFHQEYTNFLNDVISKGYAECVPEHQVERCDGKVWYIPHHGVYHPKKATLPVVFYCGAEFKGKSLNSQLLQGPYLTSSLLGILTRFRQEPV